MGTKINPGEFDCYANADPDEPMFVLLARDRKAPYVVEMWGMLAKLLDGDPKKLEEAQQCANQMREWRIKKLKDALSKQKDRP